VFVGGGTVETRLYAWQGFVAKNPGLKKTPDVDAYTQSISTVKYTDQLFKITQKNILTNNI